MTYRCAMKPPHINPETGQVWLHKNRKACLEMGLANRAKETHPEKFQQTPQQRIPMDERSIPEGTFPSTPITPVPAGEPVAQPRETRETQPKKRRFSIFKKEAEAAPESETRAMAKKEAEPVLPTLPANLVVAFWSTMMSFVKGGIEMVDRVLKVEHPYDTSQLQFTTSEEEMIGDSMGPMTAKIFGWFGIKTLEAAQNFVASLVIFRIFGRIIIGVSIHFAQELRNKKPADTFADRKKHRESITVDAKVLEETAATPLVETPPPPTETPEEIVERIKREELGEDTARKAKSSPEAERKKMLFEQAETREKQRLEALHESPA